MTFSPLREKEMELFDKSYFINLFCDEASLEKFLTIDMKNVSGILKAS